MAEEEDGCKGRCYLVGICESECLSMNMETLQINFKEENKQLRLLFATHSRKALVGLPSCCKKDVLWVYFEAQGCCWWDLEVFSRQRFRPTFL